jgi:hypothetical protein
MTMDPDTLSGSIVVSEPKLFRMPETFEQLSSGAGLTPAQCALIRASLSKARVETARLVQQTDAITERVEILRDSRSPQGAQGVPRADGSSRA